MGHYLDANLFHLSLFGLCSWHHAHQFEWKLLPLLSHTHINSKLSITVSVLSSLPLLLNSFGLCNIHCHGFIYCLCSRQDRQSIMEGVFFLSAEQEGDNLWMSTTESLDLHILCFWWSCFTHQTPWQGTSQGSVPKPNSVLCRSNTASWCTDRSALQHSDH